LSFIDCFLVIFMWLVSGIIFYVTGVVFEFVYLILQRYLFLDKDFNLVMFGWVMTRSRLIVLNYCIQLYFI